MNSTDNNPKDSTNRGVRVLWGVAAVLLALGIFLRVYNLEDFPIYIHNDESAQAVYVTPPFLGEKPDSPMWGFNNFGRHANFGAWLTTLSVKWFGGKTLWAIRMGSMICGVLSIVFFALFIRAWLGLQTMIFFLAAVVPFHLHVFYSRTGFHYIQAAAFCALVSFLFARTVKAPSFKNSLLLGIGLGFALMVYSATLVLPAALIGGLSLFFLTRPLKDAYSGNRFKGIAFIGLGVIVGGLLSMGQHLYHIYQIGFSSRFDSQSVLHKIPVEQRKGLFSHLDLIWESLKSTLRFFYQGDSAGQYGFSGAPLESVSYALACVGLVALIVRCLRFDPIAFYVLLLGATTVVGSALMVEANFSPHLIVFAVLIPFSCALGASTILQLVRVRSPLVSALLSLAVIVPWTIWNYEYVSSRDARKVNLDTFVLHLPIDRNSVKTTVNLTPFYGDIRESFYQMRYPNSKPLTIPAGDVPQQVLELYTQHTCPCLVITPRAATQSAEQKLVEKGHRYRTFPVPRYEADVIVME